MKKWNQIVFERNDNNIINDTLELIHKQTGLKLELSEDFTGLQKHKNQKYFNVEIKDRISESKEYDILLRFANQYKLIKVEPNGPNRLAIYPLK